MLRPYPRLSLPSLCSRLRFSTGEPNSGSLGLFWSLFTGAMAGTLSTSAMVQHLMSSLLKNQHAVNGAGLFVYHHSLKMQSFGFSG